MSEYPHQGGPFEVGEHGVCGGLSDRGRRLPARDFDDTELAVLGHYHTPQRRNWIVRLWRWLRGRRDWHVGYVVDFETYDSMERKLRLPTPEEWKAAGRRVDESYTFKGGDE